MFGKLRNKAKKDEKEKQKLNALAEALRPAYEAETAKNLPRAKEILAETEAKLKEIGFYLQPGIEQKAISICMATLYINPLPIAAWYKMHEAAGTIPENPPVAPQEAAGEAEKVETSKETSEGSDDAEAKAEGSQEAKE